MSGESKTRVLIVDDEPGVLRWLRGATANLADNWDLEFAESGETALRLMTQSTFHVVVSDMRMPRMNGAQLLAKVKEDYPETVRLVIADYADRGSVVECVGTAHQFLSKPCHPDELRSAVERARAFSTSVKSDRIKNLIAQMETLPSLPSVFNELLASLRDESATLEQIGEIIGRDIAMTAKLLQLVNSGFFGLQSQVTSPAEAASYLGLETVKALILSTQAFSKFADRDTGPISLDALWRHSLEVAGLAQKIAYTASHEREVAEESFVAGMLHDVGKLALAANLPSQYQTVFSAAETLGLSLHAAEEAAFGAHHADLGGHMLGLWGLPERVVDAITFHHEPHRAGSEQFTPAAAVHIANGLIHEHLAPETQFVDRIYLGSLGLEEQLSNWKNLLEA